MAEYRDYPGKGPFAFVVLNDGGAKRVERLLKETDWTGPLSKVDIINVNKEGRLLSELTGSLFLKYGGLIFIMASGIVLRVIAPHMKDKYSDPAIVVMDDQWRYCVSTLSGHEGGANWLCWQTAKLTGSIPVISTGTEANKTYTLGVGCRKGTGVDEIQRGVEQFLESHSLNPKDIRAAASVDIKKGEEGITRAFEALGIPLVYFSGQQINEFDGDFTPSEAAQRQLGIKGVSEPCALLAGRKSKIIVPKTIIGSITLALANEILY